MFKCNVQMLSDVMFKCNVQMSGGVRGERGRAWATPPKEVAGRAVRAAVLRHYNTTGHTIRSLHTRLDSSPVSNETIHRL